MISNEVYSDIWLALVEYIPTKRRADAANDLVNILLDHGIKESDLYELRGADETLDTAINYSIERRRHRRRV